MRNIIIIVCLLACSNAYCETYCYVGMRGEVFTSDFERNIQLVKKSYQRPYDVVEESMCGYDSEGQFLVYIQSTDRHINEIVPFSPSETRRPFPYGVLCVGLFFDIKNHLPATSVLGSSGSKANLKEFILYNKKGKAKKAKTEDCVWISTTMSGAFLEEGNFLKKAFSEKYSKHFKKITNMPYVRWIRLGQSRTFKVYSAIPITINTPCENTILIQNRKTKDSLLFPFEKQFGRTWVYPDIILVRMEEGIRANGGPFDVTGEYYLFKDGMDDLRKIQVKPEMRHLWADDKHIYFQDGNSILRQSIVEDPIPAPVKIAEVPCDLFCMYVIQE